MCLFHLQVDRYLIVSSLGFSGIKPLQTALHKTFCSHLPLFIPALYLGGELQGLGVDIYLTSLETPRQYSRIPTSSVWILTASILTYSCVVI